MHMRGCRGLAPDRRRRVFSFLVGLNCGARKRAEGAEQCKEEEYEEI
jgi:hypothetical protein